MHDWNGLFSKIDGIPIGKQIARTLYLHRSAQEKFLPLPSELEALVTEKLPDWNCIKLVPEEGRISFLVYKDFETDTHPILAKALTIHPLKGSSRLVRYKTDHNPPILHRKELLVGPDHPKYGEWSEQTRKEEELGLYENPRTIGFLENWNELLLEKGVVEKKVDPEPVPPIERHKTAISRTSFSKPVQALLASGLLTKERSLFDYGCGKGDDVTALTAAGFDAKGWDPAHRPDTLKTEADVVNLGFVLNVIESPSERIRVLHEAFSLARSVLCVGVLVENMQTSNNLRPYKDGYLTSRNTFQKYYNQYEIAQTLEDSLQKPIVAFGPGVFLVFQQVEEAESFFINRSRREYTWTEWGVTREWSIEDRTKFKKERFFKENEDLIERYWEKTLELGRFPVSEEFEALSKLVVQAGAFKRLKAWITDHYGVEPFEKAIKRKREDIIVFLALRHFQKRLRLKNLPLVIQRDILACFPSYETAWETAKTFLFQIGKPEVITQKCDDSSIGRRDEQALYVSPHEVERLDPVLRIYIQTGELFYGDRFAADEIKIHKASGKVTFLTYAEPKSTRSTLLRTKVNLRSQKVEFYDHSINLNKGG